MTLLFPLEFSTVYLLGLTGNSEAMAKNKKRNRKNKESRAKREWDFDDLVNGATNVALCFLGLSFLCFIFGYSELGFALLGICGIFFLLILAAFVFGAVVTAKMLKHIPHR